jgi:predicted alpha/beta-fold hydrolase
MTISFKPPEFRPRAPWFGGDLQTLRNTIRGRSLSLDLWPSRELLIPFDDGSGDHMSAELHKAINGGTKPTIVLVHGLTGSADSVFVVNSAHHFLSQGYNVARLNMRAASPVAHFCTKLSHAGKSDDLRAALKALPLEFTQNGLVVMGYSLGGNIALKCAGEGQGLDNVKAFISISAPVDLYAAQKRIHQWRNSVYHHHLMRGMKTDALASKLDDSFKQAVNSVQTIYDFDEYVIAPLHGFDDAFHYYEVNSAKSYIPEIKHPCLIIHAEDDPWIPVQSYELLKPDLALHTHMILPPSGGHVGFHDAADISPWHNRAATTFLDYLGL